MEWQLFAGMVIVGDTFSESVSPLRFRATGYTIRVPVARMAEVLRQAIEIVVRLRKQTSDFAARILGGAADAKTSAPEVREITALSIEVIGNNIRQVIQLTVASGGTITEWKLSSDIITNCSPAAWDRFLNYRAEYIGPSLRDAWIAADGDPADPDVVYELRSPKGVTGMTLRVPGRLLMPKLRSAIVELFAKMAA
jgi:hypothetical protein